MIQRVRALFAKAEGDWKINGPDGAGLHVVVFDELDAICRQVSLPSLSDRRRAGRQPVGRPAGFVAQT